MAQGLHRGCVFFSRNCSTFFFAAMFLAALLKCNEGKDTFANITHPQKQQRRVGAETALDWGSVVWRNAVC